MSFFAEPCNDSLIEALEAQGGFQPLSSRKRMEPGEGLNKIWMCPSSEMASALFSSRPKEVKSWAQGSLNLVEKLTGDKKLDYGEPSQLLHQFDTTHSEVKSIGSESSAESQSYYEEDYSSSEISSKTLEIDIESVSSDDSFKDERLEHLKYSLKTMYRDKLTEGARMLMNYSLRTLDNRLYSLIKDIKCQEQEIINQELKPILEFIDKYLIAVNRENGFNLKKKFKLQRRQYISRLINTTEEHFASLCTQIEKELKEKYLFKVSFLRNKATIEFKEQLRKEMNKLVAEMKEEKNRIVSNHEQNLKAIKSGYSVKYQELQQFEYDKVEEELNKIKEIMLEIEEANKQEVKVPYEKCSKNSAWLCILRQLLQDMQDFMKKYISSEVDLKRILASIVRQQRSSQFQLHQRHKMRLASEVEDVVGAFISEPSLDSVPCIWGRDEKLHRILVEEAGVILDNILSDISQGKFRFEDLDSIPTQMYRSPTLEDVDKRLPKHFTSDEDLSPYSISVHKDSTQNILDDISSFI